MALITSTKIGRTHGGKAAHHMDGALSDTYPVVGNSRGVVFNFTDGERTWNLRLDASEVAVVAARFAEMSV